MRAGVNEFASSSAADESFQHLLPTLETTTSHTRVLPCLTNEYSVVVSQDDSTITLSQGRRRMFPGRSPATKFPEVTKMEEYAALIAIDWADQQHAVSLLDLSSGKREQLPLKHTPATLQEWALSLRTRFGGRAIAVALEQARGPLIYALLQYDFLVLYPINPVTLAKYRQAFSPALGKDDPTDADYLLDLLAHHRGRLRAWHPDDEKTRTLRFLVEQRRRLSNDQTRVSNRLT